MNDNYNQDLFRQNESYESDLALERHKASTYLEGVEYKRDVCLGGVWERLKITSAAGEKSIGRPMGLYDTLNVPRMDEIMPDDTEDAKDEVARELCRMCDLCDIIPSRIMVLGLGNRDLTPDAVGTAAAAYVYVALFSSAATASPSATLKVL